MSTPVTKSIIVKGSVADIYAVWANFENFPLFMENIKSVSKMNEETSHWVMEGPLGSTLEWFAEITRMEQNKRIAWRSREESQMKTSGQVTFNGLADGQTEVTATLHYVPPAGKAGELLATILTDPGKRLEEDLRNFKRYFEETWAGDEGSIRAEV